MPKSAVTGEQLQEDFELELCQRDYKLLEAYQLGIFTKVCDLVNNAIEIEAIEKWASRIVKNEPLLIQRVVNAARYEKKLQVKR